ncbi:hypothetical protein [Faecalibacterium sp. Marseille-Q0746]|uniref:hypothetical protein n=1 Tax=Faecalibacterium sp. Marseille-Q0746 TaxID=2817019 RepID=UPI001A9B85B3|nr:hypothetical protein [Faecalibacterium sp. Marseille-Q0746]MBO1343445.1 hypothetical protein [Faecalibacterium sp. Marseille-Q0746]
MKILLASDTWSPMVNGVVRSVELLYHQLLALGHDVRVVTLAQNGHSHEENGILYVGSISAERVYPGVRISAAGALPTAARYSAEHFAQQVLDAYQQAIALKQYESEHKSILSWV